MSNLNGIGLSGLAAAYAQLQTTGNNIANVGTPGYVRQEAILETAPGRYSGAGFIGRGVNVAEIRRNYDRFLGAEVTQNTALAGGDRARAEALANLDQLLANTDDGLGAAMDDLRAAFGDLVNQPQDASAREVVIRRADAIAERFRSTADELSGLATVTDQRITDAAALVSGRLESIAELNQRIATQSGSGKPPSDLLDQRDRLIDEVAGKLQVSRRAESDGSVSLFSASGHALVLGRSASKLVTQADPLDPAKTQVALAVSGTRIPVDAATLGTGEISGLLRFRDQDLSSAQARVGRLAAAVAGAYNEQQSLGIDPRGDTGAALFSLGAPRVIGAADNAGSAAFTVTIDDASQLAATDYRLSFDGAAYRLENLADGSVRTLPGFPATIDGLRIDSTGGSMTIGDRFTLKTASAFAAGNRLALANGSGLATGLPASAAVGARNAGSVAVAAFGQAEADPAAASAVRITFTSATTFDISGTGTGNANGLAYVPGQPLEYNGWRMTLRGTPAAGDTIEVGPTADPSVDNRNARAMVGLADQPLVDGIRFNDAFSAIVADVGSRTAQAKASAETSDALLGSARAAFTSASGVNLDEEAARLLQFQQSYQASARVIATASAMFDTVLSMVSR